MQNGVWDSNVLTILKPQGDYLLVAPASSLIGYAGWQWVSKAAIDGLTAAASNFRVATGKALYVREAFRSLDTQKYYYKHPPVTGGAVAVPGTSIHGLGDAVDVWSGIDTSFTSPEHVAFEAIALKYGWHNVGRNFGEPWHFQFQAGTAIAGTGPTIPVEEDMPLNADDLNSIAKVVMDDLRSTEFRGIVKNGTVDGIAVPDSTVVFQKAVLDMLRADEATIITQRAVLAMLRSDEFGKIIEAHVATALAKKV